MKKNVYWFSLIFFLVFPFFTTANGVVISLSPEGDWVWTRENAQEAFINYEDGREKLIVLVNIEETAQQALWILPIPASPEKIEIDIFSQFPVFFGSEILSTAKIKSFERFWTSSNLVFLNQIWSSPLWFLHGARGYSTFLREPGISDSSFLPEIHIEKHGIVAEVIPATDKEAIYKYFFSKGFEIKEEMLSLLNSYIESKKDYSFVVAWISSQNLDKEQQRTRGIFVSFPTSKIYYPLALTQAYQDHIIPITIRVLGHVRPKIFSEIKPYVRINYFKEIEWEYHKHSRCLFSLSELRSSLETYYIFYSKYPSSLKELEESKRVGEEAKVVLDKINKNCAIPPTYVAKNKDEYKITLPTPIETIIVTPQELKTVKSNFEMFPGELAKFYGTKEAWKGKANYTKITIDAPAKLLKEDLWMEFQRPFYISIALWGIRSSLFSTFLFYLLVVGLISFVAGGLAGFIFFRKIKKYAILGLSNVFTVLIFILISYYLRKRDKEIPRCSKYLSFELSFSILVIALFLLIFYPLLGSLVWGTKIDLSFFLYVAVGIIIVSGILMGLYLIIGALGVKNEVVKSFIALILLFFLPFILFLFFD